VWSYADQLGVAVLTDDQTFNDAHEATGALSTAFAELRSAAGVLTSSSGKNGIERRIEQAQPVVRRTG
jgi:diacylglycerol O-acyltransferase / wax synthase